MSASTRPIERTPRPLSSPEYKVKTWIRANHGVLSRIAKECQVGVMFVSMVAYNRSKSADYRVEKALIKLGCPLIQRVK